MYAQTQAKPQNNNKPTMIINKRENEKFVWILNVW